MGTLVLLFGDRHEPDKVVTCLVDDLAQAKEQAKYWIRKKREKSGWRIASAFYSEHELEVDIMYNEYLKEEKVRMQKQQEVDERRMLERLKDKYESKST